MCGLVAERPAGNDTNDEEGKMNKFEQLERLNELRDRQREILDGWAEHLKDTKHYH